ncbi:hypothetical protein [Oryzobacter telluris]|uniref:hypothetical protein n=1 Tax=Oryzobacter telluris TaxID=3149179 RepID=UPI00370D8428
MSFDDLPPNWSDLPLDTPGLASDLADLFVGHADREGGCVAFLLAGPDLTLAQPVVIGDVPADADPAVIAPFLAHFGPDLGEAVSGLVFVRGRPGSALLTDSDRQWHETVLEACRTSGLRLVGAFLATASTVRSFPAPLMAADELAS